MLLLDGDPNDEARENDRKRDHGGVAFEPECETHEGDQETRVEGVTDASVKAGIDQPVAALTLVSDGGGLELSAITLITGAHNQLWRRDSVHRMYEWLTSDSNQARASVQRRVLREYAHQDLLWGERKGIASGAFV